jgi:hypothetical protein
VRVLATEALLPALMATVLHEVHARGELFEASADLSDLPLNGRHVSRQQTGLSEYVARCALMASGLAHLGAALRSGKTSFSQVQAHCKAVISLPPGENFSPLELWATNAYDDANETLCTADREQARATLLSALRAGPTAAEAPEKAPAVQTN